MISITDGQIFLESDLFWSGQRPAVNVGLSVSRVGGSAQVSGMKQLAGTMRLALAQYRDMAAFAQFGSDLDKATREQLAAGERLLELLKQGQYEPKPVEEQIVLIYAATQKTSDGLASWVREYVPSDVPRYANELIDFMRAKYTDILSDIRENPKKKIDDAMRERLNKALGDFAKQFEGAKVEL